MSTNTPRALRFTGDGSLTVEGVPPKDLTADDIAALGPVLVHSAEASGLYERVSATQAKTINDEGAGAPDDEAPAAASAGKASQ